MKIPNNEMAIVEDNKISDYLLNASHKSGKHKAKYFKNFGFDPNEINVFKEALFQHSIEREIETEENTKHGKKYKLICEIKTPDNRNPCVITVWIVENGNSHPRLITAYPTN